MPAGAALPLLQGLARGLDGAPREMVLEYLPHLKLRVRLAALGV
jgi:hypothetical protein